MKEGIAEENIYSSLHMQEGYNINAVEVLERPRDADFQYSEKEEMGHFEKHPEMRQNELSQSSVQTPDSRGTLIGGMNLTHIFLFQPIKLWTP